jgi:hypothetical protein
MLTIFVLLNSFVCSSDRYAIIAVRSLCRRRHGLRGAVEWREGRNGVTGRRRFAHIRVRTQGSQGEGSP